MKHCLVYLYLGIWNHLFNKIPSYFIRYKIAKYFYRLKIGDSTIGFNVKFFSPWSITIGDNCNIQMDTFLDGRGGLIIGNNVDLTPGVKVLTMGHDINSPEYNSVQGKVVICDNVVVFSYAIILPKVNISEGVCIGAGSVVTKSISEKYCLYAGNPARFLSHRNKSIKYCIKFERCFH